MAQATEIERPPSVFYCHECNSQVFANIPALTCSRCNSSFIEEMEDRSPASPSQNDPPYPGSLGPFADLLGNIPFLEPLRTLGNNASWQQSFSLGPHSEDDEMEHDDMAGLAPGTVFHFTTGDLQHPGVNSIHGIINHVLQRLGNDLGGGGRTPVFLRGNPGDYAWGPNGLDAIITQLLNHLEGTGAPPAAKEKIDKLPTISIEQYHLDEMLQCSICMDDFELAQVVKKLPCDHLYHPQCIVKWLEMHGTCPVCRKDMNGEDTTTDEADFPTSFMNAGGPGSSSTTSTRSSSAGSDSRRN